MRPVYIFLYLLTGLFFNSPVFASSYLTLYFGNDDSKPMQYKVYPYSTTLEYALQDVAPFEYQADFGTFYATYKVDSFKGTFSGSCADYNVRLVISGNASNSSPCIMYTWYQEPDTREPDSPFCIVNPYDITCVAPYEPSQAECSFGVGAPSCCASIASASCGGLYMSNVLDWGLNESLDTCSYTCTDPEDTEYSPPPPPEFTDDPLPEIEPTAPAEAVEPEDLTDPLSVGMAKNTNSIHDLNRLIAESSNITNELIFNADKNNQSGLVGVVDAVNAAASSFNMGSGTALNDTFGDGSLSEGDKNLIRSGLGLTGEESGYSGLESTVTLSDFSDDFNYSISADGCPAPYQMEMFGSTFEFSYQPMCDIFSFAGYLVILAGVFLTPFIVFGFKGK